jgi:hypothetical protein
MFDPHTTSANGCREDNLSKRVNIYMHIYMFKVGGVWFSNKARKCSKVKKKGCL